MQTLIAVINIVVAFPSQSSHPRSSFKSSMVSFISSEDSVWNISPLYIIFYVLYIYVCTLVPHSYFLLLLLLLLLLGHQDMKTKNSDNI